MLKHHKLISFAAALLFLIVLQRFAVPIPIFRFLLPAFLVYVAALTFYNRWYLKQIQKYDFWVLVRPVLLLSAAFGIFLLIPSAGLRGAFMLVTVVILTFFQIVLGNSAENLSLNETLLVAFGLFFALFGAYYYAPSFEPLYLAAVFLASSLLARSFYQLVPQPDHVKSLGALLLGLFSAELYWALNFLHFHFSALALLLFDAFYFCLVMNYYHLYHLLNFKKVQFHLFLIAVCAVVALAATPWQIIQ